MNVPPILHRVAQSPVFWIILVGIVSRLVVGAFFLYPYDSSSWARIAESSVAGTDLYDRPDNYYAPIWGYVLTALAYVYKGFGGISFGHQFDELLFLDSFKYTYYGSMIIDPAFLLVIRTFLLLVDVAVGLVVRRLVLELGGDERRGNIALAIWFLCPLVIYSSATYVIFDNLEVLFLALCLLFVIRNRPFLAGFMMLLAGMTKPFAFYLAPLLVAWFILGEHGMRNRVNTLTMAMGGFVTAFLIIFLPVMLNGEFSDSLVFLTGRVDSAESVASGGSGYVWDVITKFGPQVFIWLQPVIIALDFLLAWWLYRSREQDFRKLLLASILVMVAVFMWPVAQQCYYLVLILLFSLMVVWWKPSTAAWLMLLISIPSVVFLGFSHNFSLLLPLAAYTDVVSMDWVLDHLVSYNLGTGPFEGNLCEECRMMVQTIIMFAMAVVAGFLIKNEVDKSEN